MRQLRRVQRRRAMTSVDTVTHLTQSTASRNGIPSISALIEATVLGRYGAAFGSQMSFLLLVIGLRLGFGAFLVGFVFVLFEVFGLLGQEAFGLVG